MKIAVVSDIHGNLVAVESILPAIEEADRVVCLGDVAATGPQPRQTVDFLRRAKWPCVMGNTDERLANSTPEDFRRLHMPEKERRNMVAIDRWTSAQLDAPRRKFISEFSATVEVDDRHNPILCYHGSPRSNTEEIRSTTPDEKLTEMFAGHDTAVYAGGHTHAQMVRKFGRPTVINPGSVGLPFLIDEAGRTWNPAWAEYAMVTSTADDFRVELRRRRYGLDSLKDAARRSGMPDSVWWLRDWVQPKAP